MPSLPFGIPGRVPSSLPSLLPSVLSSPPHYSFTLTPSSLSPTGRMVALLVTLRCTGLPCLLYFPFLLFHRLRNWFTGSLMPVEERESGSCVLVSGCPPLFAYDRIQRQSHFLGDEGKEYAAWVDTLPSSCHVHMEQRRGQRR